MGDESRPKSLSDYITLRRGTTYKGRLLGLPGPLLLGLATIQRNGGFREDSLRTYGGDCPEDLLVHPGKLYVSLKDVTQSGDLLGAVAKLPDGYGPGRLTQDTVRLVQQNKDVPTDYIYWLLRTPQYRDFCRIHATGTTNLGLPRKDFLAFPVPKLTPIRKTMIDALTAVDDKVELNRRMNETLNATARALFNSWFVDFDPVGAKGDSLDPRVSQGFSDLFPESFDDAGRPRGWTAKPLSEIAEFLNGLAMQKFPATEVTESLPVIKISELRSGVTSRTSRASRNIPSEYVVRDGDFLFSWSGSLIAKFWTGGEGALNQHLFKVTSDRYPIWFCSQWVYHHLEEFRAIAASKATTMGHIQRRHLEQAIATCPPDRVLVELGHIMDLLLGRVIGNELESRTLVEIRDHLLSKLITGELRVMTDVNERGDAT